MIRKDYRSDTFPVCSRAPVLCIDGQFNLYVAYNRFDLVGLFKAHEIKVCYGVWPGRQVSDCFILDPEAYEKIAVPPENHKNIDNASDIVVHYEGDTFTKVVYSFKSETVESKDPALFEYMKAIGIRFSAVHE